MTQPKITGKEHIIIKFIVMYFFQQFFKLVVIHSIYMSILNNFNNNIHDGFRRLCFRKPTKNYYHTVEWSSRRNASLLLEKSTKSWFLTQHSSSTVCHDRNLLFSYPAEILLWQMYKVQKYLHHEFSFLSLRIDNISSWIWKSFETKRTQSTNWAMSLILHSSSKAKENSCDFSNFEFIYLGIARNGVFSMGNCLVANWKSFTLSTVSFLSSHNIWATLP